MNSYARVGAILVLGTLLSSEAFAESRYSDWEAPVNLRSLNGNLDCSGINTGFNDAGPGISKDGLSLYFASNRPSPPNPPGTILIYVAQRASRGDPWGPPQIEPILGQGNVVSLSRDGHWVFFNSTRPGGFGDVDIWASYRQHVHDDFDWQTPINLGPGVNTDKFEAGASYFENEDGSAPLLFFGRAESSATQATTTDIWVADLLPNGTFGNARRVDDLSSPEPYGDQRPSIRFDGLEIFFFSNRPGSQGTSDIWVATRKDVHDPLEWDPPVNLGPVVNSTVADFNPHISGDGLTLYFASSRSTWGEPPQSACGGFDIYMSTRKRSRGADKAN